MAAHDNRGRLVVNLDGNWRLYTTYIPVGARALGVINSNGKTGALVQTASGIYARVNAGAVSSLPQRKLLLVFGKSQTV